MTDPAKRERAALDVLELLPEWWAVGQTSYDPGTGRWTWTARGPHPGRGKHPETITGTGEDELAAMIDLPSASTNAAGRQARGDRPPRPCAFLEGVEAQSRAAEGRPLTADELERITKRYPGS